MIEKETVTREDFLSFLNPAPVEAVPAEAAPAEPAAEQPAEQPAETPAENPAEPSAETPAEQPAAEQQEETASDKKSDEPKTVRQGLAYILYAELDWGEDVRVPLYTTPTSDTVKGEFTGEAVVNAYTHEGERRIYVTTYADGEASVADLRGLKG